ncbi:uncharacterized protein LACBIDRAFT_321354 [Laccaria bicolor S238N-H82]|uniref:Predicted protein n=1 Tax=Laccaria bicolor (strain S238N-H82 / ATCC MYA-4686) TaxID=486041 RepID=B0CPX1_LACBS|nr:uncharacterized protein LACBIDRAFT_321354 [Laccaria bicolor S238N-H82]EDR15487.1 predicted protein [Laccaria bicolor S238N-H82]|eukprot:XP_001873695.1 predicted protein [Laccaria bicolor S238N-H82]
MDSGDRNPTDKSSSEDGRSGTKLTPGMRPGARYIYYRLYTKDGPLESNSPIYSNDRFISRIASSSVRPPHTATSLLRYLCKIEGLALQNCILFQSLSEITALDDLIHLSLWGTTGPGTSNGDPMALVVDKSAAERRSQVTSVVQPQGLFEGDHEHRYVYYCVYDDDGEIVPKTSFDDNNPSLGRIKTLSVPPPHTVSSLKNYVIKSEDVSAINVLLFEDEGSESAMTDNDALTLLSDTFPGFTEDRPIAITYESGTANGSADNEDPDDIQTRKLMEALAQVKKELNEVREGWEKAKETHVREINEALSAILPAQLKPSTFTKILKATNDWGRRSMRPIVVSLVFIDLSRVIPPAEVVDYRMEWLPGDKLFWKTGFFISDPTSFLDDVVFC